MSYCRECGNKLEDNQKYCSYCGTKVDALEQAPVVSEPTVVEQKPVKEPVVNIVFAIIGLVGGICSFVICCTLVYSIVAVFTGIPSLVFSSIGKKSKNHHGKAVTGFVFSLISIILGVFLFVVLVLMLDAFEAFDGPMLY